MTSLDVLNEDIKEMLFRAHRTEDVEKKADYYLTVLELLKIKVRKASSQLPMTVGLGGKKKVLGSKEELLEFIQQVQEWLLEVGDSVETEDLPSFLRRAQLLVIQLVYSLGIHRQKSRAKLDFVGTKFNSRESASVPLEEK